MKTIDTKAEKWKAALRRASLPDAVRVVYRLDTGVEDGVPTRKHRLTSYDASEAAIGDDRDYDILKAVMMPLENLAEDEAVNRLVVTLNLVSGSIIFD